DHSADLLRCSHAHDGCGDGRVTQRPGNSNLTRSALVAFTNLTQELNQTQVAGEQWLLEIRISPSPIIWRKLCNSCPCHSPSQQSRVHRGIDDHADVVFPSVRKYFFFGVTGQNRIRRLKASDGRDTLCAFHLSNVEV